MQFTHKLLLGYFAGGVLLVLLMNYAPRVSAASCGYAAATGTPITGFAWSDTIGWIDMHCSNSGVCGANDFGLAVDRDGMITGTAWSENVGWVSANSCDLAGCPSGACTARMGESDASGWLRVVSGGGAESGGWDGFISLSGVGYVPTLTSGTYSGYSWGDTNVGWVDWSSVRTTWKRCEPVHYCVGKRRYYGDVSRTQCSSEIVETVPACFYQCSNGSCIPPPLPSLDTNGNWTFRAVPNMVRSGNTTTLRWRVENAETCLITGNGDSWTLTETPANGVTTRPIIQRTTYHLHCVNETGALDRDAEVNIVPGWQER